MSVTTSDLKSMMNRVRRPDAVAAPGALAIPSAPIPPQAPPPPPGEEPVEIEATASPAEDEPTDIGTVLAEIMRDEELITRILGILYRAKKKDPHGGAVAIMPMERELGIPRESATFVLNYMKTKHIIEADDKSRNSITVEGIDFLRARLSLKS